MSKPVKIILAFVVIVFMYVVAGRIPLGSYTVEGCTNGVQERLRLIKGETINRVKKEHTSSSSDSTLQGCNATITYVQYLY